MAAPAATGSSNTLKASSWNLHALTRALGFAVAPGGRRGRLLILCLSLCPKQAKGVTGVQGTIRAEPLTMTSGGDTLTLRFDCKPCEMHVVGRIKRHVLNEAKAQPITFYRARKAAVAA